MSSCGSGDEASKKKNRYEYCRLSHNRVRCFLNAVLTASGSKYSNIKQRARVGKGSRGRRVAVRTFAQRLWPETARPLMNANSFCFSKKKKGANRRPLQGRRKCNHLQVIRTKIQRKRIEEIAQHKTRRPWSVNDPTVSKTPSKRILPCRVVEHFFSLNASVKKEIRFSSGAIA